MAHFQEELLLESKPNETKGEFEEHAEVEKIIKSTRTIPIGGSKW